ncbi:hypothetical protein E5288_WYG003191 [Bos mutus]|uniref:Uncharacterized protein n=1 Tax=Bos mutus TaxID=72004 RepID=A0A6B0REL0_9CETA|nr:hypothetical protein [Bos mutus]
MKRTPTAEEREREAKKAVTVKRGIDLLYLAISFHLAINSMSASVCSEKVYVSETTFVSKSLAVLKTMAEEFCLTVYFAWICDLK